jgi:hypothetical protein
MQTQTSQKKPYHAPILDKFGSIAKHTQDVSTSGMGDGGMAGATKT